MNTHQTKTAKYNGAPAKNFRGPVLSLHSAARYDITRPWLFPNSLAVFVPAGTKESGLFWGRIHFCPKIPFAEWTVGPKGLRGAERQSFSNRSRSFDLMDYTFSSKRLI